MINTIGKLLLIIFPISTLSAASAFPEFTEQDRLSWINSQPISKKDLIGNVILLDFWTFDCWNCYRSIPWMHEIETKYKQQGLKLIGIHSPEFEHEKNRDNVIAKMAEFRIDHPVMLDNNFNYWNKMSNKYWPAFYIIGKKGNVRGSFIGETHTGDSNAKKMESLIIKLLNE